MTRLGFLLDSDSCIGCHACTVACKSEHKVPLGVNRTWVKYVETGVFPNVGRHFSVMRCNQCRHAPCIEICPTGALFRADNGVVDFDDSNCIGCKGCMNACPYDAIFINPATNTANKCNFCNHRIEVGLEPSCVIVCPTHAIRVADFDDPLDPTAATINRCDVAVRSPEQNTKPLVFYRGAHQASLEPTRTAIATDGMIWAETTSAHPTVPGHRFDAGVVARTAYTTPHPIVWKGRVSGYLVTKAIAAGVMAVAGLQVLLGNAGEQATVGVIPAVIAGVFLAITGVLLVADLRQPTRFHYLITRGNRSSWLVKGAYILMANTLVIGLWWIGGLIDSAVMLRWLAIPAVLAAAGTAGYTALLFGQCEGRDLWQSPLVLPMLLAQAATTGGAVYALLDLVADVPDATAVWWVLLGGTVVSLAIVVLEITSRGSRNVEIAVRALTRGRYRNRFRFGVVVGMILPAVLVVVALTVDAGGATLAAIAAVGVLVGTFAYEDAFVRAGQSVPLS